MMLGVSCDPPFSTLNSHYKWIVQPLSRSTIINQIVNVHIRPLISINQTIIQTISNHHSIYNQIISTHTKPDKPLHHSKQSNHIEASKTIGLTIINHIFLLVGWMPLCTLGWKIFSSRRRDCHRKLELLPWWFWNDATTSASTSAWFNQWDQYTPKQIPKWYTRKSWSN